MTPAAVRAFILAQQQENDEIRSQLTALASELAQLRERIGRSSRNSSKPPSSDGPGFKSSLKVTGVDFFPKSSLKNVSGLPSQSGEAQKRDNSSGISAP